MSIRVSDAFNIGLTQPSLDFVDVPIDEDVKLFIEPRALLAVDDEWTNESAHLVQTFFSAVLASIRKGKDDQAMSLLQYLREPNETRFGLSSGRPRGRALGPELAEDTWTALRKSGAIKSGLVEDLEDTVLLVPGVGPDIISDITTNIIRGPLIVYTHQACETYGIPVKKQVDSGPIWDGKRWHSELVPLPVVAGRKLLLVPKAIVRRKLDYDPGEYYYHYILEELRQEELAANSPLVKVWKRKKTRYVTKTSLEQKYGAGKLVMVRETLRHPTALQKYRKAKGEFSAPLEHSELMRDPTLDLPDWDALVKNVLKCGVGQAHADQYEKVIEALLSALFYPALMFPQRQSPLFAGRKRVDIRYTNAAKVGFFDWLADNYRAPYVFVECKNYKGDPANPELDQLAGRFSNRRGRVGLLVCRKFTDKNLFIQRCRDTADSDNGYIIALDDADLIDLATERQNPDSPYDWPLLRRRFNQLVM